MRARVVLCMALCGWLSTTPGQAASRPNILFCFADDWGRFASCYRGAIGPGTPCDVVRTPAIDALAAEGVLFPHAFVNAPSCTPCRSALLSGQYFWRTGQGAILHGAHWDPKIPAFPLLLRDGGYHIGKMAKVWSPGAPPDAPFDGQKHAYQKAGGRYNQFSEEVTTMVDQGYELIDAKGELLREVRANFRQFLAAKPADAPFCFWFGPTNVHRKWVAGSGKALWGLNPDDLQGKLPPFIPDVPAMREDFADYLGETMAFDAMIAELVAELKSTDQYDNTLIVVSGDHGPPGFPHGKCNLYDFGTNVALVMKGPGIGAGRQLSDFVNLMDLAPTFLEAGGVPIPDVMTGNSLWPIVQGTGTGQVDPARSWVVTGRERHVSFARDDFLPYPQRALRTADHLYIVNFAPDRWPLGNPYGLDETPGPTVEALTEETYTTFRDDDAGPAKAWLVTHRDDPEIRPYFERAYGKRPRTELYDLKQDPHQLTNVAADPAYADIAARLEAQLLAELERTADPRVKDGGAFFETPPMAGPVPGLPLPKPRRR